MGIFLIVTAWVIPGIPLWVSVIYTIIGSIITISYSATILMFICMIFDTRDSSQYDPDNYREIYGERK